MNPASNSMKRAVCRPIIVCLPIAAFATMLAISMVQPACAKGDWQPQHGPKNKPQFIVPPGEDPAAHDPSHWGLVNQQTMPAEIPSLQKPTQNVFGPKADYTHETSIGRYQPFDDHSKRSKLRKKHDQVQYEVESHEVPAMNTSVQRYPGFATPGNAEWETSSLEQDPSFAYPTPNGTGYIVEQPLAPGVEPRLPFLRMTEEEAAYQSSPYHVKDKNPPLSEILKTGAYYASYESQFMRPHFQSNTAISFNRTSSGFSRDYDFDFQHLSKITIGFESQMGPGAKLTHLEMSANSDTIIGRSDGVQEANASIFLTGPQIATTLTADDAGERIETSHRFWIKDTSAIFFKEIKMPVSRLNGLLGFRYINIHHTMRAELLNAADARLGILNGTHYFRGMGPTIGLEYFRPIGHTQLEFIGGASTSLLFGNRDQIAFNTATSDFTRFGADEMVTINDAKLGVQWVREWGRRYRLFARGTIVAQSWYGGGTSSDPVGDFGLFGFAIAAGLNH